MARKLGLGLAMTVIVALLLAGAFSSCKKAKVSFTNPSMKAWFDTYCASCHAAGKPHVSTWLYNPDDFNASIKEKITDIYREVVTEKSMPPSGLSQAEFNKFLDWYNAGYSAK